MIAARIVIDLLQELPPVAECVVSKDHALKLNDLSAINTGWQQALVY